MREPAILLVDSVSDEREMYAEFLVRSGFRITTCRDDEDVLRVARHLHPDAIVVRRETPARMAVGEKLIAALRHQTATARTPVVMLGTRMGDDAVRSAREAGADEYILLPCLPEDLAAHVRAAILAVRTKRAVRADLSSELRSARTK